MKFEKIRENKIKVTLSLDELKLWGVSADALRSNSPAAQDMFWNLMRRAEKETGFVVDNSRLVVEALPVKDDGVILFVTRSENAAEETKSQPSPPKNRRNRCSVKNGGLENAIFIVTEFDDFEKVIGLAHALSDCSFGTLYLYGGKYYLSSPTSSFAACSEYGRVLENGVLADSILSEHGQIICADFALRIMRDNF